MDPLSILSATETAIGITKNVAETLSTLIAQTQNADRSLEQLYREVTDFEGVLQRMNYDFSDQKMRAAAFETQTGNIDAHWNAVLQAILKCNERLEELEKLLKRLAGNSSVTSNKIVKGFRLNFATSDIHFFQSEIEAYKKNITLSLSMILVYVADSLETKKSKHTNKMKQVPSNGSQNGNNNHSTRPSSHRKRDSSPQERNPGYQSIS
jgi:chromosome segregation ATPase